MDFNRNEKTGKLEESWCEKISRKYKGTIPVITKLPKDGEKSDIRFRGLSRLINLASTICTVSPKRFNNVGDVHRAAHYIGINILFNSYGRHGNLDKGYGADMYKILSVSEKYREQCIILDDMLDGVRHIISAGNNGILSRDKQNEHIDDLIDSMPNELRKLGRLKINELRGGRNITELKEMTTRGGDQKSGKGGR
jgi:hypothetical protein